MARVNLEIGPRGPEENTHKSNAAKYVSSRLSETLRDIDAMIAEMERAECYQELTPVLHVRRRYELLKRINDHDL